MKITIAAATPFEIKEDVLKNEKHETCFLYTGVGILASAVSLTQHVLQQKPGLVIQAGIAGCFDTNIRLGDTVVAANEYLGDTGVWEKEEWRDLFDLNLQQPDGLPFIHSGLQNEETGKWNLLHLPEVTGVTVNEITTDAQKSNLLQTKYKAAIESMEGASLHYVCRLFGVPFIQVRSISNYIGERDKAKWKMKEAILNVNEAVKNMMAIL